MAELSGPKRIGEILLQHGCLDWESFAQALADQRASGIRLASLLVARRVIDFDDASRALAGRHGVAAALRRHLEKRDREATRVVPVALARRLCALPLGRMSNGTLIVCVRDPSPEALAELVRVVGGQIALAIAPAQYLERLVEGAYPPGTSGELQIPVDLDDADEPELLSTLDFDLEDDGAPSPAEDGDFAIDIELPSEPNKPVSTSSALPVAFKAPVAGASSPQRDSLDATLAACKDIDELPWLLDVVMAYVAKRWTASLLVEIRERRGVGVRGHGSKLKPATIKTFVVALDDPSIIQRARNERRIIEALPDPPSEDDTSLASALAGTAVMAAPISKGDAIAYVLAVGDSIDKDPEETPIDLGMLTDAVGEALARL